MALYKVGDSVVWVKTVADHRPAVIGTVVAIMPSESEIDEFSPYDIEVEFGTFTLQGAQLKARASTFPCKPKDPHFASVDTCKYAGVMLTVWLSFLKAI